MDIIHTYRWIRTVVECVYSGHAFCSWGNPHRVVGLGTHWTLVRHWLKLQWVPHPLSPCSLVGPTNVLGLLQLVEYWWPVISPKSNIPSPQCITDLVEAVIPLEGGWENDHQAPVWWWGSAPLHGDVVCSSVRGLGSVTQLRDTEALQVTD